MLCCGYTLTDFPISTRLTSLALWQSNDYPSASKATLMNMDKYFMWNHYERLHNHNKAKHNKTVCIFIGIYCNLVTCGILPEVPCAINNSWDIACGFICDQYVMVYRLIYVWVTTCVIYTDESYVTRNSWDIFLDYYVSGNFRDIQLYQYNEIPGWQPEAALSAPAGHQA